MPGPRHLGRHAADHQGDGENRMVGPRGPRDRAPERGHGSARDPVGQLLASIGPAPDRRSRQAGADRRQELAFGIACGSMATLWSTVAWAAGPDHAVLAVGRSLTLVISLASR